MNPISRSHSLKINIAPIDGPQSCSKKNIEAALQPFGVVTEMSEVDYLSRNATYLRVSSWIRFTIGGSKTCYQVPDVYDVSGTEISEDQLQYLRENSVCVEMVVKMPVAPNYVPPSFAGVSNEADFTFVSSYGFPVDTNIFESKWLFCELDDLANVWLRIKLTPTASIPMHTMTARGVFDLKTYDPALLGFVHHGQLITHPFYSHDGKTLVDPKSYGFETSYFGGRESLELAAEGGKRLLITGSFLGGDTPSISLYNNNGYMIASCDLFMVPVQGQ